MNVRPLVLVAIISLFLGTTTHATAQTVREYFNLLFEDGARLAEAHDYEGALRQFERAMAYSPSGPNLLWNIASCHLMLGDRDRALAFDHGRYHAVFLLHGRGKGLALFGRTDHISDVLEMAAGVLGLEQGAAA